MSIKAITLSADMIQRRDDMRTLLGDCYEADAKLCRTVIRGVAKEKRISWTEAALEIAKDMDRAGRDPSLVIAGLVDLCEGK